MYPFASGLFTLTTMCIYFLLTGFISLVNPQDNVGAVATSSGEDPLQPTANPPFAILLAFIGCTIGWMAVEFMALGLLMSKSALASYAEQAGVIVPFCFDALALGRPFLKTDWLAVFIILILEVIMAMRSIRKRGEAMKFKHLEIKKENEEGDFVRDGEKE